jgi:hypothetical protein
MAHIPGLYLKPESFSPSYGRKKMTDTQVIPYSIEYTENAGEDIAYFNWNAMPI